MVQAAPPQFLKAGSIYCEEREIQDLADILDAKTDRQLKRAVGAAIYSGTCAPPTSGPVATTQVAKKQSPGKKDILCFEFVEDDGSVTDRRFCAEAAAVTTVAAEKKRRIGTFKIVRDGVGMAEAECTEGGRVLIFKGDQWTRGSVVFPRFTEMEPVPISKNMNLEFTNGCKGVDSPD